MKKYLFVVLFATVVALLALDSCKKVDIRQTTTEDVNLLEYLRNDSLHRFTQLVAIIDKTGYDAFMNAYGTYTIFAPTNDAISAYLKQLNKSSIDDLTVDQMKDLLKFHLLEEVVYTSDFNDGKLSALTMFGQYLVTGITNTDGVSSFIVNRQAAIIQPNILVGNGIIQVIDHVLIPSAKSIAQIVSENTDYSIFTQAISETGYYDTLNTVTNSNKKQVWLTLLAEPNSALLDSGIHNYAELKAKYHTPGKALTDKTDSLNLYVAYHILPEAKYLADIVTSGSHETLVNLEVVTDKMINKQVFINDDEYSTIGGIVHEPGIQLDQANSDLSATNGVVHRALGNIQIKVRSPFPVYWDLCATNPELTRLSAIYRKKDYLFDYGDSTNNTFKDIKWEQSCLKYRYSGNGYLGDYWSLGMGTNSSNTASLGVCLNTHWIEFTTPLLVKGKYNVWLCYYTQNSTADAVQGSFDSIPLTSALVQFNTKIASISFDQEATLLALGWKWWAATKPAGATAGRMLGIVDVKATGRHKIRFDLVSGANADCNFDMIHFIPVGTNQVSPRFDPNGTIVYY